MMVKPLTHFSVIRYVPDPIKEEQINIGIIAASHDGTYGKVRFAQDFSRARLLGNENIKFLREFAEYLANEIPKDPSFLPNKLLTTEGLKDIAVNWQNSIQFSEPKASILPLEQVIEKEFERFIHTPAAKKTPEEHRAKVLRTARNYLSQALTARFHEKRIVREILRTDEPIHGKRDVYNLPLVIKNEHPYLAAAALSFTLLGVKKLAEEIRATAWTVEDIRSVQPRLRLVILAEPPGHDEPEVSEIYNKWKLIYVELGSEFIEQNKFQKWAIKVASELPLTVLQHR